MNGLPENVTAMLLITVTVVLVVLVAVFFATRTRSKRGSKERQLEIEKLLRQFQAGYGDRHASTDN